MSWLQKLETRSIVVTLLSVFFICTFSIDSHAEIALGKKLYNGKSSLILNDDLSFTSTDSTFTKLKNGKWVQNKKQLILYDAEENRSASADTFNILYSTEERISLANGKKQFTFRTNKKETYGFFSSILKGMFGLFCLILIGWLFSSDRKNINWPLVVKGIVLQLILALLILKVPFVEEIFEFISKGFVKVVDMAHEGATFVFGDFVT